MKTSKTVLHEGLHFRLLGIAVVALMLLAMPVAGWTDSGDGHRARILSPHAKAYGKSYGEWAANWWRWAYSLPGTNHPLFDHTGADAAAGQSGKVWFLGGSYAASSSYTPTGGTHAVANEVRDVTIPKGKAIFFPILNFEMDNFQVDSNHNQIDPANHTEAELRQFAAYYFNGPARNVTATIDGRPVSGLTDPSTTKYRVQAPLFQYTLPAGDNLYTAQGYNVSGPAPAPGAIDDGIYLMLAPLSEGHHTLHFTGEFFVPGTDPSGDYLFSLDITYELNIVETDR